MVFRFAGEVSNLLRYISVFSAAAFRKSARSLVTCRAVPAPEAIFERLGGHKVRTMSPLTKEAGDFRPIWWLWLPCAMVIAALLIRIFKANIYWEWMESEIGFFEIGTVVVFFCAAAMGVTILRQRCKLPVSWLRWWILLATAGCVYVAGEEMSWGQHYFGWETPEVIRGLNDQSETNIHNMSSWFDQKPRLLLEFGILLGGIAYPIWARGRQVFPRCDWRYWIWPTPLVLPTALIVFAIRLPERFARVFDWVLPPPLDIRASEVQEFYIAWFLLLYLGSIARRLGGKNANVPNAGGANAC